MNELPALIKQENGKIAISAKELYLSLGLDKSHWTRWSKMNITENQFAIENEDWVGFATMANGNETTDYVLTLNFAKRLSMTAKTEIGEKVRKYFIACEEEAMRPKQISRRELALMVIQLEDELETKQKLLLETTQERDIAVKTKAEIGSRREATAMATASIATKELTKVKTYIGECEDYATIKAVERFTKKELKWKPLKDYCTAHELTIKDVPDLTYGKVKSYPKEAWLEIYGINLTDLFGNN